MLSRRLIASTAINISGVKLIGAALLFTACAGVDGTERGAIREAVIEPGITGIEQARSETCSINASTLRTAIDSYTLLEGGPPPDEQSLVDEGFLRGVTEDWDVVDGVLVAENPACGDVSATVPTEEIVTEEIATGEAGSAPPTVEPLTVDDVLATFDADEIESVGGDECARQLAVVFAGASLYTAREGVEPDTLDDVETAGYFDEPVTMWQVVDGVLRPAPESSCSELTE